MKLIQIVFSPTGGTQKVANAVIKNWSASVVRIDLTHESECNSRYNFENDDIVLLAVPSYGGRVPEIVAKRILNIHGNQALCIIVCVYGNRAYDDTLLELKDLAEKCNFHVVAAISAVAEHSIMHQYAVGRPDKEDERDLSHFGERILNKISGQTARADLPPLPGKRPYKKAGRVGLVPKTGATCTRCGHCAKNCPAGAISKDNPLLTENAKCISCMRCVTQCPASARRVNGALVFLAGLLLKRACSVRKKNELFL